MDKKPFKQRTQDEWNKHWADRANGAPSNRVGVENTFNHFIQANILRQEMSVLDLGCGLGDSSAWLAEQGYTVHGIDYSQAAIDNNRQQYGHLPNLKFDLVDVTQDTPTQQYDFIIDKGVLHAIPSTFHAGYVRYVTQATHPNAHFVIVHRTPDDTQTEVEQYLKSLFTPQFEFISGNPSVLVRVPSLEVHFKRL